jgi:branched-chain amino acid transport system permease protein
MMRRNIALLAVVVPSATVLVTLPWWMPPYYLTLTNRVLYYSLLALSFSFLAGRVGMVSLGQVAFFGFAAYAVAILTVRREVPFPLPPLVGIVGGTLLAAGFGLIAIRTSGIYFLMITLALGQVMWGVANRWVSMTNAYDGIPGLRAPVVAGINFQSPQAFYLAMLTVAWLCIGALYLLSRSHFGLALRGIRASPTRMAALGYPVARLRYLAFVIAGALASVSGVFFAYHTGYVNTSVFDLQRSVWVLLVSILGGVEVFAGPIAGVAIVVVLESVFGQITQRHALVIGIMFLLTVILAPDGILGRLRTLKVFRRS